MLEARPSPVIAPSVNLNPRHVAVRCRCVWAVGVRGASCPALRPEESPPSRAEVPPRVRVGLDCTIRKFDTRPLRRRGLPSRGAELNSPVPPAFGAGIRGIGGAPPSPLGGGGGDVVTGRGGAEVEVYGVAGGEGGFPISVPVCGFCGCLLLSLHLHRLV